MRGVFIKEVLFSIFRASFRKKNALNIILNILFRVHFQKKKEKESRTLFKTTIKELVSETFKITIGYCGDGIF